MQTISFLPWLGLFFALFVVFLIFFVMGFLKLFFVLVVWCLFVVFSPHGFSRVFFCWSYNVFFLRTHIYIYRVLVVLLVGSGWLLFCSR